MIDLSTQYLGLKLKGPLVVSSTPLSGTVDSVRRLEECGASAIVLTSLFEEQLMLESSALDEDLARGTESFAESLGYLPDLADYRMTHEVYLDHLRKCKAAVNIPIMASLNGVSVGGWVRYAKACEEAGADAIELNTYAVATDTRQSSEQLETQLLELVASVTAAVKIPVAVKLSQSFTSLPHLVAQIAAVGARGVVFFNRFYQPDLDIEALEVRPTLHFSSPSELLPRLHWAAILYSQVDLDLAISGGVHSAEGVIKSIMAGASVAMMASALHIHGIEYIGRTLENIEEWLGQHEYGSIAAMRGCLSRRSAPDASPFNRGNYIKTLSSYSLRQTIAAF
ncbi:MAG TPA: dihydroorotate dehydrogenase-like protein [Terracidiphilus sp.]|nr:dihydroorotate dehydrogenase-like protein [Terracidiphilus sp.]